MNALFTYLADEGWEVIVDEVEQLKRLEEVRERRQKKKEEAHADAG